MGSLWLPVHTHTLHHRHSPCASELNSELAMPTRTNRLKLLQTLTTCGALTLLGFGPPSWRLDPRYSCSPRCFAFPPQLNRVCTPSTKPTPLNHVFSPGSHRCSRFFIFCPRLDPLSYHLFALLHSLDHVFPISFTFAAPHSHCTPSFAFLSLVSYSCPTDCIYIPCSRL